MPDTTYRCPTDEYRTVDNVIGCGHEFTATPDEEGYVDCPECGMWFEPREQDEVIA